MKAPVAFKNGVYMPASECNVSVFDLGITNSAAVTDFIRTFNFKPFRVEDHAARIHRACKNAYIKPDITYEQTIEITNQLVKENAEAFPAT